MKRVIEYLKRIKKRDNVVVIFHNDGDGVCSATLINKFLIKWRGRPADMAISQPMPPNKNLIEKVKTTIPTKIIFTDLAIDQDVKFIKKFESIAPILVIDHHEINNNISSKRVVYYNPRMYKKDVYKSATYVVYKITSKIVDMSDSLWIAAIGIISDYDISYSKDILRTVKKKYPNYIEEISQEGVLNSTFGQMSNMIAAAKATKELSCEQMVNIFTEAKTIDDVINGKYSSKFIKAFQKIQNELERLKIDIEKSAKICGKVVFYEFDSKYNFRSPLSSVLSDKYPNKVVIVWEKSKGKVKLSARTKSQRYNVGKILKFLARDIKNSSAGGHPSAGGATIPEKNWEEFKENLVEFINAQKR